MSVEQVRSIHCSGTGCSRSYPTAEALDRLSRDQEDVAALFKRVRHADVRIVTLAEGEIGELHIGLKGTMNALFLKDLADKTRRGLRGRVEQGRSAGGLSFGYDIVRALDGGGEPVRGGRAINDAQAATRHRQAGVAHEPAGVVGSRERPRPADR